MPVLAYRPSRLKAEVRLKSAQATWTASTSSASRRDGSSRASTGLSKKIEPQASSVCGSQGTQTGPVCLMRSTARTTRPVRAETNRYQAARGRRTRASTCQARCRPGCSLSPRTTTSRGGRSAEEKPVPRRSRAAARAAARESAGRTGTSRPETVEFRTWMMSPARSNPTSREPANTGTPRWRCSKVRLTPPGLGTLRTSCSPARSGARPRAPAWAARNSRAAVSCSAVAVANRPRMVRMAPEEESKAACTGAELFA